MPVLGGALRIRRSRSQAASQGRSRACTLLSTSWLLFFFFQAEDGIRDDLVTGVQTCALPILGNCAPSMMSPQWIRSASGLVSNPNFSFATVAINLVQDLYSGS